MADNEYMDKTDFKDLEPVKDIAVAPAHGIAAMALNFALRYHDINTVQDGVLYQQYKMEGKNMVGLHLDHVFETAIRMERHILSSSDRVAVMIMDAVFEPVGDDSISDGSGEAGETEGLDPTDDSATPKG
jgi:ribulose 1,5-bisphosphate carboxylase large subunit-like protein